METEGCCRSNKAASGVHPLSNPKVNKTYDRLALVRRYELALRRIADLNTGFSSDADEMNQIALEALSDERTKSK